MLIWLILIVKLVLILRPSSYSSVWLGFRDRSCETILSLFNKFKRDMNNIDEWFDNMTVDEIVEYGKELDADLLIGTIDYHYNVE